eukprot:gene6713-6934_t
MALQTFRGLYTSPRCVLPLSAPPNQLVLPQTHLLCSKHPSIVSRAPQCQILVKSKILRRVTNQQLCTRATSAPAESAGAAAALPESSEIGIFDVEELSGIRANLDNQEPVVEYRVRWKDGSPDTCGSDAAASLLLKGDVEAITSMLKHSRVILSQVVDENRRRQVLGNGSTSGVSPGSAVQQQLVLKPLGLALHFVAAIGNMKCVKLLIDAGADLDLQDKEGYTPLHMACGYMQTGAMTALLESGADPLIKDKQGRDVVSLVDNLRKSLPPNMAVLQRIMALEQPAHILDERPAADGTSRELLVQFQVYQVLHELPAGELVATARWELWDAWQLNIVLVAELF